MTHPCEMPAGKRIQKIGVLFFFIFTEVHVANGVSDRISVEHVASVFGADVLSSPQAQRSDNAAAVLMRRQDLVGIPHGPAAENPPATTSSPAAKNPPAKATPHETAHGTSGIWAGNYNGAKNLVVTDKEKEVNSSMAKAVAWILIGTIVAIMATVYLVHFNDEHIKHASWHTISNAVSLFCAVLLFKVIKLAIKIAGSGATGGSSSSSSSSSSGSSSSSSSGSSGSSGSSSHFLLLELSAAEFDEGSGKVTSATMIAYFMTFLTFFVLLECMLLTLKQKPFQLAAWGLTGAHLVGFMAAYAFGTFQMAAPFSHSAGMSFFMIPISALVIGIMCGISGKVRGVVTGAGSDVDEHEHAWEHQCVHTEDEIVAFAVGLIITQFFRFSLVGSIPYFSGPQVNKEGGQIMGLFAIALLFLGFVVLSDVLERKAKAQGMSRAVQRCLGTVTCTLAMTVGWSLLFFGKWFFWWVSGGTGGVSEGNILLMQMEMAIMFSGVSFAVIIGLDFMSDKFPDSENALRAVAEAFELLVSLSWEALFMTAIAEAMHSDKDTAVQQLWNGSKICLGLYAFIMPGWVLHILPKAMHKSDHGHKDDHGHHEGEHADATPNAAADDGAAGPDVVSPPEGDPNGAPTSTEF